MDRTLVERFGIRAATKQQIAAIQAEATARGWGARFASQVELDGLHDRDRHFLAPLLRNGAGSDSLRCYLWFRQADGGRTCVLIDVSESQLLTLERVDGLRLELLAFMLIEQLPLT